MRDPRDEELERRRQAGDEPPDGEGGEGREDGADAGGSRRDADGEGGERIEVRGRLALSDEVARRWDPGRLVKAVSKRGGSGQPLDATTRARFERKLGVDLGGVRIYTGEFAEQVTKHHSAEAVTVGGTGMILMSGTPDRSPATAAGQALLAHELTHVAQSARGVYRSAPGERPPLATEEHEAEAEAAEAQVLQEEGGSAASGEPVNPEKALEELTEKVAARVLEMVYEDERVHALRNGADRTRP